MIQHEKDLSGAKVAGVVGLGYVGLPLAREACRAGYTVVGIERRDTVAKNLNEGVSHVQDVPHSDIDEMCGAGFLATTDTSVLASADVIVICVGTPLGHAGDPDLSDVESCAAEIAPQLKRGCLVVLESTTYPGTTGETLRPILESGSGLRAGVDFNLAYSPERTDTGNTRFSLRNTPKIVGGYTESCAAAAVSFYSAICDQVVVAKGLREAEMAKLIENTYRNVNIALANEFAMTARALDVDIWDAIACAATKPFGFQAFHPGPGVGGHCIPKDPVYLSWRARQSGTTTRLVELAAQVNNEMPAYVARRALTVLADQPSTGTPHSVLLLGVAYKRDSDDSSVSPAVPLARHLRAAGVTVLFHDPMIESWPDAQPVTRVDDWETAAAESDLVVLVQDHRAYDLDLLAGKAKALLDTRGVVSGPSVHSL